MPRVTVDELIGYQVNVAQGTGPVHDDQGAPVVDEHGVQVTQRIWVLIMDEQRDEGLHRVQRAFTEAEKTSLVQALTGGVIVAAANGHV